MVKSRVEELLLVYQHLFVDAGNTYPDLRDSFRKDYERLSRLSIDRGIHLFLEDMPSVGKHLDRCLAEERFIPLSMLPLTRRVPSWVMYPEFLGGLWDRIFYRESGCLKEDADVEALLFLRQFLYLAKKVKFDCPLESITDEVGAFHDIDIQLPDPEEVWYTNAPISEVYEGFANSPLYQERLSGRGPQGPLLNAFLQKLDIVSAFVNTALGSYDPYEWRFRHGPGVVSERSGFVNKYQFVNWSGALEAVFPSCDFAFANHSSWADHVRSTTLPEETPVSRLIAVPKTLSKPRLIAAEPSEHMWCQQNIWDYFCSRTRDSWISNFVRFRDQSRNQELCKRASMDGTLATLDLSSASDRVTCHFVGQLFRSNPRLLEALRATRTQWLSQDLNSDIPALIRLKKFSTMGSACTFPVESIGFLCVALAAYLTVRKLRVTLRNILASSEEVTIFGDDIIIPVDVRELCCEALEVLDFKVNTSKSFWSGNFRESCGVDAYKGVSVTPVYLRSFASSEPESVVSTVQVRNSFYRMGYWSLAEYLTSTIPRVGFPTVRTESGVLGLWAFCGARISGFKRRINRHYQRDEVYCLGFRSKRQIREITDDSVLLQFFTENPEPHQPWAGGVGLRPKTRLVFGWMDTSEVVS